MGNFENNRIQFDNRTGQLISRCLHSCRYREDLIVEGFPLASDRRIPVVTFAHHPRDARSSCIAFLPESRTPDADLRTLRELGIPIAFLVGAKTWEMWSLRSDGARREKRLDADKVERFFEDHKADFAPGAVFRAKTWARAGGARQLDFVDAGLLPMVEKEAGARLRQLFEEMLEHSLDALGSKASSMSETDSHWLVRANFWLLAGKLMRDKSVPKFTRLDLNDVQNVFDRVADHYDAPRIRANGRLRALRGAADLAAKFASLRCISTETLGALYEEALLSPRTRKLLSVHRTPTYLVDYMLARMSRWMEEDLGVENCRVWEPSCGHAPFLVGAVRLLSDLLPDRIASDRTERRKFLRTHIGGCDRDAFALEIARLSLTLADIPNPNGWKLDAVKDMFDGDYLARNIAANSVIIANPPFEGVQLSDRERSTGDLRYARSGQAGELLRRIVNNASSGALFGIVVPQAILDGASFRELRNNLLSQVDVREIVTFPDNVFKFAKPETAILFGRKLGRGEVGADAFKFRRVLKPDMETFRSQSRIPTGAMLARNGVLAHSSHQLLLPPLAEVWRAAEHFPRLDENAHVTIGFYFFAEGDKDYPIGESQVSEKEILGFDQGFLLAEKTPDTHMLPKLEWLNQKDAMIRRACGGTKKREPRVVMNHVRTGGGAWRHKAFIDAIGHPATDAFLLLTPTAPNWSLEVLWAFANGPFANAFTLTNSAAKQIGVRLLKGMRVPNLSECDTKPLENAVCAYLTAARAFSASQCGETLPPRRRAKKSSVKPAVEDAQLPLDGLAAHGSQFVLSDQENLRALHWRVDAEVLKLYALPAGLERELLDFFDGVPRVGVPFEQRGYIPLDFRETQRLDEYLRITDEWEHTDDRRSQLVEKEYRGGGRTAAENAEFVELQRLYDLRRCYCRWQRTGDAHSPLIDEEKLKRLISEDSITRRA
jgi:hypothetical protein